MNFGAALDALRAGQKCVRKAWLDASYKPLFWVELQVPDTYSKMSMPYIYVCSSDNNRVPWNPAHADLLADDWLVDYK